MTNTAVSDVRRVVDAFAETWNRHDMDAFARLFADDAEFVNVVGLWWKGRDEIRRAHEATHATIFKHSRLTILETSVRFVSPQFSIARSRWRLEGHVDPDGRQLPPRDGIFVNVLAADNDRWMIVDTQNTDIIDGVLSTPQ